MAIMANTYVYKEINGLRSDAALFYRVTNNA